MDIVIQYLIYIFIAIIILQIIEYVVKSKSSYVVAIEGMENNNNNDNNNNNNSDNTNSQSEEYKPYDQSNPTIMAEQNAGNIEYLKSQMDKLSGMYLELQDLSGNVASLQTQVNEIVNAQQDYASQLTGGETPNITGVNE